MGRRRTNRFNNMHGYNNSRAFNRQSLNGVPVHNNNSMYYGMNNMPNNVSKSNKVKWIVALVLLIVICAFSFGIYLYIDNNNKTIARNKEIAAYNALVEKVTSYDSVFANGIYVDGISLGGLSYNDGKALVDKQIKEKKGSWQINILYKGNKVFSINDDTIGHDYSAEDALQKAWQAGKSGDVYEREKELDRLAATRTDFYSSESDTALDKIDNALKEIKSYSYIEPVDAKLIGFDNDLDYPFVFEPESFGRDVDVESAWHEILQLLENYASGDIELKETILNPNVTVDSLRKKYKRLGKATTEISKNSTEDRTENIRVAFSKYDGMRIKPGKRFSFNSIVGLRTPEKGFLPAIEYSYGKLVEGYGGGVCQASTTTYQAVLKSGLRIVKRYPHSLPVNYTELGMDATVYYSRDRNIDFVFENNTDHDIYIRARVVKNPKHKKRFITEVSIYGYSEDDFEYKIESLIVEELEAPLTPEYIKDKKAEYVIYNDEEYMLTKPKTGCVVDTYLVKYSNGSEIERKKISTDTYDAKPAIIYIGVTPRF